MNDMLWIKERFDKIDADNGAIIKDLGEVKTKVIRHGVYWDVTKWSLAAVASTVAGYFGLKK